MLPPSIHALRAGEIELVILVQHGAHQVEKVDVTLLKVDIYLNGADRVALGIKQLKAIVHTTIDDRAHRHFRGTENIVTSVFRNRVHIHQRRLAH